jgi:hypothetical protein
MKINANRLAARVHDALTRDFNENHAHMDAASYATNAKDRDAHIGAAMAHMKASQSNYRADDLDK